METKRPVQFFEELKQKLFLAIDMVVNGSRTHAKTFRKISDTDLPESMDREELQCRQSQFIKARLGVLSAQ